VAAGFVGAWPDVEQQLVVSDLDLGRGLALDDAQQVALAPQVMALAVEVLAGRLPLLGLELGLLAADPNLAALRGDDSAGAANVQPRVRRATFKELDVAITVRLRECVAASGQGCGRRGRGKLFTRVSLVRVQQGEPSSSRTVEQRRRSRSQIGPEATRTDRIGHGSDTMMCPRRVRFSACGDR
jgi:hypothetical protein